MFACVPWYCLPIFWACGLREDAIPTGGLIPPVCPSLALGVSRVMVRAGSWLWGFACLKGHQVRPSLTPLLPHPLTPSLLLLAVASGAFLPVGSFPTLALPFAFPWPSALSGGGHTYSPLGVVVSCAALGSFAPVALVASAGPLSHCCCGDGGCLVLVFVACCLGLPGGGEGGHVLP